MFRRLKQFVSRQTQTLDIRALYSSTLYGDSESNAICVPEISTNLNFILANDNLLTRFITASWGSMLKVVVDWISFWMTVLTFTPPSFRAFLSRGFWNEEKWSLILALKHYHRESKVLRIIFSGAGRGQLIENLSKIWQTRNHVSWGTKHLGSGITYSQENICGLHIHEIRKVEQGVIIIFIEATTYLPSLPEYQRLSAGRE